ncbi:hypothetical protein QJ854_gp402 [Moumouvirus goulette]|uniref:Uncharacterized protein n=1 Tax=Moumouvirus goulette TaxID=1247379 RepID=M1NMV2_9VIRU|nr:hypothetical protein QJ854_gp402 [Moumouvirus goulette]AGF85380.1 hypothetical protein glt_00571 [Moumouvirus goulette]
MQSTGQRRGASNFQINDILGPKFKEFINLLETQQLQPFLVKNIESNNPRSYAAQSKYAPNDLHYDFSEYLIAASAAFKRIENPDLSKAQAAEGYGENIGNIFDELVSGRKAGNNWSTGKEPMTKYPSTNWYEPKQLVFEFDPARETRYLLPGYHLLPFTNEAYGNYNAQPSTALVNAIRYLYNYIALLDVQSSDATDIINTLKNDNLYFNRYINDAARDITTGEYFSTPINYEAGANTLALTRDALLRGMTGIAWQIINRFRQLDTQGQGQTSPANIGGFPPQVFADKTTFAQYFGKSIPALQRINPADIEDVYDKLVALNFGTPINAAVKALNIPEDRINKYNIDAVLNPEYITNPIIDKVVSQEELSSGILEAIGATVTPPPTTPPVAPIGTGTTGTGTTGTAGPAPSAPPAPKSTGWFGFGGAAGKVPSLPYLYNFQSDASGKQIGKLVTEEQTAGARDAIVDPAQVAAVQAVAQQIENLGRGGATVSIPGTNLETQTGYGLTRALLLGILYLMVTRRLSITDLSNGNNYNLVSNLSRAIASNYPIVQNRLRNIPTGGNFAELRDPFISEYTLASYKSFERANNGTYGPRTQPMQSNNKGSNLRDPEIYNFYTQVVASRPDFYDRFFNLVRTDGTGVSPNVPILEAIGKQGADLDKYRLNVKKIGGYTRFTEGQRGGQFGDVVFISLIPAYPADGSIGRVWLTKDIAVDAATLTPRGAEALRIIARNVYYNPSADTVNIYGNDIPLAPIIQRVAATPLFSSNYQNYFSDLLRASVVSASQPTLSPLWKENENRLNEYMLRHTSKWERVDDDFILKGPDGNPIAQQPADNCTFIANTEDCLDVLRQCLAPGANINEGCARLTDFNFTGLDVPASRLKQEVMKINPLVAFNILRQFGFASYLTEEKYDPFNGFRRYKVQTVGTWLKELVEGSDRCNNRNISQDPCQPQTLRQYLGDTIADKILAMARDPTKFPFFNYLDILVDWVNANSQVLNPEESKFLKTGSKYPPINDSFKTYDYLNPYKPAEYRLRNMTCGLERLKTGIFNDLSGINSHSFISNLASVPVGIQMPLSRSAFVTPSPFGNYIPVMTGGQFYELENELKNINGQYGFTLFNQIYQDLLETMKSLQGDRRISLSTHTQEQINEKLENFKKAEEALRESIIKINERNKLYQASRGYVNPFNVPADKLPAVLAKHSNLLQLNAAYNKKAINLIDLFKTISEAIISKLDEGKSMYTRPLTATFH